MSLFLLFLGILSTEAWVNQASLSLGYRQQPTCLFYSSEFDRNELSNSTDSSTIPTSSVVERLRVNGVSVSPKGFHVLLESTTDGPKPETAKSTMDSNEKQVQDAKKRDEQEETKKRSSTVLPLKMTNAV